MDAIETIKQQAANWLSAKTSDQHFDQSQFDAWYNADPKHRIVFNDMEEDWDLLSQVDTEVTSEQAHNDAAPANNLIDFNRVKKSWLLTTSLAAAASVVLCTLTFVFLSHTPDVPKLEFASALEVQHNIKLNDNSVMDLNASSKVQVSYTDQQRLITILKGDATFTVAKDSSRPFVVQYKEHKFTALGTAFTVNTRPKLQLVVTEHSVKVEVPQTNIIVSEGHGVEIKPTNKIAPLEQVNAPLGWLNNELIFDGMHLSDVIAIIQPYLKEQIHLVNIGLADQPVSGRFELDDPIHVLDLIARGLNLRIEKKGNRLLII